MDSDDESYQAKIFSSFWSMQRHLNRSFPLCIDAISKIVRYQFWHFLQGKNNDESVICRLLSACIEKNFVLGPVTGFSGSALAALA